MRFKLGFLIGAGIGYVLGAKAGKQRYEQIMRSASRLWESDKAQEFRRQARGVVESATEMVNTRRIKLDQDLPARVAPYVAAAGIGDITPH